MPRSRLVYACLILLTMAAGLASRHFADHLPDWVRLYLGDAIWALLVFWGFAFFFRKASKVRIGLAALAFSYVIEFSQLYHAPWIDAIRNTRLGGLILGFGFLWSDLLCYAAGISFGMFLEMVLLKNSNRNQIK